MASIEGGDGGGGHKKGPGVKKAKKLSTRVDMTPMVDLGFLLITFFIFTATLSTPSTLDLNMPKDTNKDEEQTKAKQSGALTIMLGKNNNVYYYEGELAPDGANFKQTTFKGIRDIIINKKKSVIASYTGNAACEDKARKAGKTDIKYECADEDFVVVIKPTEEATYKNTVDILDEMAINNVKRFAMVKIADSERELISATEGGPAPATTPAP
ncbi:MAG: biopolymer transporter ExbD [Chitinophagaceae bacterium]